LYIRNLEIRGSYLTLAFFSLFSFVYYYPFYHYAYLKEKRERPRMLGIHAAITKFTKGYYCHIGGYWLISAG
jgi:hypothetical protein